MGGRSRDSLTVSCWGRTSWYQRSEDMINSASSVTDQTILKQLQVQIKNEEQSLAWFNLSSASRFICSFYFRILL
jgi:hypothetical protein